MDSVNEGNGAMGTFAYGAPGLQALITLDKIQEIIRGYRAAASQLATGIALMMVAPVFLITAYGMVQVSNSAESANDGAFALYVGVGVLTLLVMQAGMFLLLRSSRTRRTVSTG
ncbi:hypothetical protein [Actinomyces vulturis]|uniref:hypothetical protein n=1 Tax=Actinomyces vulturis TaxID=1857645 RepID=UPI000832F9DC|nr:hypothetical protein [Actinomyces vulturis]